MADESLVEPAVRARIESELGRIESERAVRMLLAVESGSRAWGFPSADSDYDVRFIYVGTLDHYLSITPRRDVIEQPIADHLDLSGWDLRKALQLALRSNAVLVEWLSSPLRYHDEVSLTEPLREIVRSAVRLPALEYHYDRSARRVLTGILDVATPRLKSYFYALRPVLALRWLRAHETPPPMDLPSLMAGVDLPGSLAHTVRDLLTRKLVAREDETVARAADLDRYLQETLCREVPRPTRTDTTAAQQAQRFFESVLHRSSR